MNTLKIANICDAFENNKTNKISELFCRGNPELFDDDMLGLFSLEKRKLKEDLIDVYKTWKVKKRSQGVFRGAWWQDKRWWTQNETQEVPFEHQETLVYYGGDWAMKHVSARLWSLPLWIYSKSISRCSWADNSTWPWLSRVVGPDDLERSFTT